MFPRGMDITWVTFTDWQMTGFLHRITKPIFYKILFTTEKVVLELKADGNLFFLSIFSGLTIPVKQS